MVGSGAQLAGDLLAMTRQFKQQQLDLRSQAQDDQQVGAREGAAMPAPQLMLPLSCAWARESVQSGGTHTHKSLSGPVPHGRSRLFERRAAEHKSQRDSKTGGRGRRMADVQDHMFAAAVRWDLHFHLRLHARRRQTWIASCPRPAAFGQPREEVSCPRAPSSGRDLF